MHQLVIFLVGIVNVFMFLHFLFKRLPLDGPKGFIFLGIGPKLARMKLSDVGLVRVMMWSALLAGGLLLAVLWLVRQLAAMPLPGPWPIRSLYRKLRMGLMPIADIYPYIKGLIDEYGGIFQTNISGFKTIIITDPVEVEIIMSSVHYIQKGYEYFILQPWLREGLLLSEGNKWHQRRKLLTPTFHFKILEDSLSRQSNNAEKFVKKLLKSGGQPHRIEEDVRSSTLDIICETALGLNMSDVNAEKISYVTAIKRITEEATRWYLSFWLHIDFIFKLSSLGKSYYKNLNTIHTFSQKVISQRKREFTKTKELEKNVSEKRKKAFLDRLLEIDAENPGLLSLVDIQEEVDTFTFEGHDTTSAALSFSLFVLANHPDVQERAYEEQRQIFGYDAARHPTTTELNSMTYLEMVIKETLRLYPSVPIITRRLTRDLVLSSGVVVPPGYNLMIVTLYVHRNEKYWPDPEEFRPERFLPGVQRHPFSFIPFSAGPRNCIGQKFAMMEMKTMLSAVLRNCRLEPVTKSVRLVPNIILKSEEPIYVKIFPRNETLFS